MRTLNPSLALASLVGFLTAASCTLITDVDRTKILPDAGTQAEGGSGGTGGSSAGKGGSSGDAGAGDTGGKGGKGGSSGSGTMGGSAGTGVTPTPECKAATGKITVSPMTFLADKDTLTLSDGVNKKVVFEFDFAPGDGVASGHTKIVFDGSEDGPGIASLIANAINTLETLGTLRITAATSSAAVLGGAGASGASGAGGASSGGAPNGGVGGEGGAVVAPAPGTGIVTLTNDLAGALGNVKISDTVGNPNLTTSGMSGGKAVLCDGDASCKSPDECASEDCGDDSVCVPVQ